MNDNAMNDNVEQQPTQEQYTPGSSLPFVLAAAVMLMMAYGGYTWWRVNQWERSRGEAIELTAIGPPLTEFELTERSGAPFRTEDMQGKVWVATYFFTTCPGTCIRLNQNIQLMHNMPELADVTWVSITCDPDNDSLAALRDYADRWKADPERWLFCRADLEYTQRIAKGMNLALKRQGHQDYAIVIDKSGKFRGVYNATSKADCQRLHERLLECLAEEVPTHDLAAKDGAKTSG